MRLNFCSIPILKRLIAIPLFIIGILDVASAQDIITLKNGDEIQAKVNDARLSVVKYTKFDNQTGPVYTVDKADIFMIKYENGTKDVFDYQPVAPDVVPSESETNIQTGTGGKLTSTKSGAVLKDTQKLKPYEVKVIMNSNYSALHRYKGGRAFKTVGIIFLAIGGIDITTGISNTFNGYDATSNFLVGGVEIGIGLFFGSISKNKINSSVVLYNLGLKNQHSSRLNLGVNRNGLGLCLNF